MTIDVAGSLVRAVGHLEQGARSVQQGLDTEIPKLFFKRSAQQRQESAFVRGIEQARIGLAELDGVAGTDDARRAVEHLLDIVDSQRPSQARHNPSWIPPRMVPRHLEQYAQGLRLHAELAASGAAPAAVRGRLREEIEQLALRPFDEVADDEVIRVGHVAMLPDHLRPDLPSTLNSRGDRARLALDDPQWMRNGTHVASEFHHIRMERAARELAADPTVTREALDAELRTILAKPDADITLADSERVSLIARMPDRLRPELLDRATPWTIVPTANFASWSYTPAKEGGVRGVYDSMRRATLEDQLLGDPTFTREVATNELRALVARPAATLSSAELIRASTIAGLPEHVRPPLPTGMDQHAVLGEAGRILRPWGNRELRTFAAVRDHLADLDPEAMARELVRQDRTGAAIDLELIAVLAKHDGMLERVGVDAEFLHRQSIQALATAGGDRSADLASSLRIARDVVERHRANDASVSKVRAEALELAERNLARMDGTRTDTYGRHPDYAEVGRFASIATLLHQMRELDAAKAAAAAKAATANGTGLTW